MSALAIHRYHDRANWALTTALNATHPFIKSEMLALSLYAAASLLEMFDEVARSVSEPKFDVGFLPHAKLIDLLRNLDAHGSPIPILDPHIVMQGHDGMPGQGLVLGGTGPCTATVQMQGCVPVKKTTGRGKVTFGSKTVFWSVVNGRLFACEESSRHQHDVAEAIRKFLEASRKIIDDGWPYPTRESADAVDPVVSTESTESTESAEA